jgi:hypothetical protein
LTGHTVTALPYYTDFLSQEMHASLCSQQVTHIYIGTRPQSFKADFVKAAPTRYEVVFQLPNTQIVKVLGCNIE